MARRTVRLAEEGELGIGHPKGLFRDVGSRLESRDPMMVVARLARPRCLRADRRADVREDLGLVQPL